MKKIILFFAIGAICFTDAMAQDSIKTCQSADQTLQNLMNLSNFPQYMTEVANGLGETGYTSVYDCGLIQDLDKNINEFNGHDTFTLIGKKGESTYTFIGMEVLYQREVLKKKVLDKTNLIVHAQDANGNYIDLIMRPKNYHTMYELQEHKQENKTNISKDTLPFLIIEEGTSMYTIRCSNDDLFSLFDREVATYIEVVLTLKNY